MGDFLLRLVIDSDGLVVGIAIGAIFAGLLVAPVAYEAGRRRTRDEAEEEARKKYWPDLTEEPGWPLNDRSIAPRRPREPA